jgi:diguanylate cyclase (GGDEF)-like protein
MSLSALYPAADLLLLFGVSLAVFRNRDGQAGTVFGVLAGGMLVFLVTDMAFAYMQNAGTYASGSPVDAGWTLGFLLTGYGGLMQLSWRPHHSLQAEEPSDSAWKQGMPLVIMLLVTCWTLFDGVNGMVIGMPLLGATLLTVCAVVLRQFLTLRENIRLRLVLEAAYRTERERARLDPLTGKLNRRAVVELVETLLSSSSQPDFALAMVDVNGMKQINDAYGHHSGDDALAAVAAALSRGAIVGRYGGDEFLAVLEGATRETVDAYRDTLLAALEIWSASRDDGLSLSVSIGFAFAPGDGRSAGELIKAADRRMYEIKRWAAAA